MTTPKDLLNILENLTLDQFKTFKWFLKQDDITNDFSAIPVAQLEDADRKNTVDLMVQKYTYRALKRTETILKEISRNDLLQCLPTTSSKPKDCKTRYCGPKKERHQKTLQSIQQFEVDVTLDPETAHPNLILSADGKRVHHGDVRQNLPHNPERFHKCVNVLGKQGFTRGKFYFQVQVKGKTAWALGVARESIKRKGNISANPKNGYWTIMLTDEDEYQANEDDQVCLSLKSQPEKVGVFVDYEEGQVSFYDVDSSDHLYSFTDCSFTEKLFPFFTPFTNDDGRNSAPLIISPVSPTPNIRTRLSVSKEDYGIKKAELQSIQQFEVEVTLDPETAHPALILSEDGKRVHATDVKQKLPYNPKRFNACVNVLGKQSISSGKLYYEVQVKGKTAWTVGVASESISRKDQITLGPENGFWTVGLGANEKYTANDHPAVLLSLKSPPKKVGVFVDYEEGLISFYNSDTAECLYSFTGFCFTENLLPFFSPCTNDGGENSAPLIISSVSHSVATETHDSSDQEEDDGIKKAELQSIQQFEMEVTLDPETAHPNLILSEDGKRVHHGDVRQKLSFSPKRFNACVNVLGKQSISSGKFYYEVQVKGKTAWTVGVASESISRKDQIALSPENGFWTVWLRNNDEYTANDHPAVLLSLKSPPKKVGVFVEYEEGLVCFYNSDTAECLYSFTGFCFTENLLPYFSPCTNDGGENSAPLIISSVGHSVATETHDSSDQEEDCERKKAELQSIQQFEMEVTLDPETAHPNLILSEDGKRVHHGDVRQKLSFSPKRFRKSIDVLGKQSFSSGKAYYEVQVKGKTAWDLGIAVESIDRKGNITLSPLSPEDGIWIICLRNENEYKAIDDPIVSLSPKSQLQKVGVFVDYEEGLISFYNSDTAECLYSFTSFCFTEKLLPYFSPCTNDSGRNSAPLIICPVNRTEVINMLI